MPRCVSSCKRKLRAHDLMVDMGEKDGDEYHPTDGDALVPPTTDRPAQDESFESAVARMVADAPPLTPTQVEAIVRILRGAR